MNENPPRTIYLQWLTYNEDEWFGPTWCEDKINEDDFEYTLSSFSAPWNDVLKALGNLYEKWARNGAKANQTQTALNDLMQAYDKWLD